MQVISQAKTLASNYSPYLIIFIVFLIICAIAGVIYGIVYAAQQNSLLANPSNIQRIIDSQSLVVKAQYNIYTSNLQAASKLWSNVPENQKLLINMNMVGVRLAGYLGPFLNGVFSEDTAVSTALMTGARVIFIDIDVDSVTNKPTLVYRDVNGFIKSLNKGTIKKVAKAISDRAFSSYSSSVPRDLQGLPMIVVLYFHKTPDIVQKPNEYINFLIQVSKELQDIQPNLLAQTAQGDFRRQGLDTQLFFQPMKTYKNKIILLCNVDTTILRNAGDYGVPDLGPGGDLDLLVNARLYSQQSGTSFGATSVVKGTSPPAAILTQPDYFINMPPENRSEAILLTKKCFTITMNSDEAIVTTKPILDTLIGSYGVHCAPLVHFMDMANLSPYFGIGNLYEKSPVLAKSQQLRFVPPEPIVTQVPNSNMNTQGGFIRLSNI
jgi:hypothetical protein